MEYRVSHSASDSEKKRGDEGVIDRALIDGRTDTEVNLKKPLAVDTDQSYTMQARSCSCNLCAALDRILEATTRLPIEEFAFRSVLILIFRSIFGSRAKIENNCDLSVIN